MDSSILRAFVYSVTFNDKSELSVLIIAGDRSEAFRIFNEEYQSKMEDIESWVSRAEGFPLEQGIIHAGLTRASKAMSSPGKTFVPGPEWRAAREERYASKSATPV